MQDIVCVTGSTRCGTSLVMAMLHAGGFPVLADNHFSFESDRVLNIATDRALLDDCRGRAVKILEPLYIRPFPKAPWRFILMGRDPVQQGRSQAKFGRLVMGQDLPPQAAGLLANSLMADYPKMRAKLLTRGAVLDLAFEDVLSDPAQAARLIEEFVGAPLDIAAMVARVVPRSPDCYPGLLELDLMAAAS